MASGDDRIAAYLAATDRFTRSYDDPELWFRLEPVIRDEMTRVIGAICETTLQSYEAYREKIGFLRGLDFVMREAAHLTRREPQDER